MQICIIAYEIRQDCFVTKKGQQYPDNDEINQPPFYNRIRHIALLVKEEKSRLQRIYLL